jgi:hypothetical protein
MAVGPKSPALEGASRTGHPKFRILTASRRAGVVLKSVERRRFRGSRKGGPPAVQMKPGNLKQVFSLACVWVLSVFTAVPAQNLWHPLPTESSRTTDTDIVGATVDAVATRGGLVSKARVVVSGQKGLGTALVGIWVEKLNAIVSDDDLWPYTGPPLGTEAKNPHMIEIALVSSTGKFLYSSRLVMLPPESFPKGIADGDDENLLPQTMVPQTKGSRG